MGVKREVCLKALNLADSVLSNMNWSVEMPNSILKSEIDTIKVRDCYNQLACSCNLPETLTEFKRVLALKGKITADSIVDFRNAIRRELNYGKEIDTDRVDAYIVRIHGDKK